MSVAAQSPFPAHSSKRRFESDSPEFTGSPSSCGGGKRLRQLSGSPSLEADIQAYAVRPGLVGTLQSLFPGMDEKVHPLRHIASCPVHMLQAVGYDSPFVRKVRQPCERATSLSLFLSSSICRQLLVCLMNAAMT